MSEVKMRKYGCVDCCDEIPETEKYCEKCKNFRKITAVCKGCDERFVFKNGKNAYSTGYYCDLCLDKKDELLLKTENCLICNKEFYKKCENHKYCSDNCRNTVRSLDESDRFSIFRRDNFRCLYCGRSPADGEELTLDHIYPYSMGGTHTAGNLVTACSKCNGAKHNTPLNKAGYDYITSYVKQANKDNCIHPDRIIKGSHTRGEAT